MNAIFKKLASRKLWMAIAGVATGIAIALGASTSDLTSISNSVVTIVGCLTSLISAVTYIKTEGQIDATSVQTISNSVKEGTDAAQSAVDTIKDSK